jgi:hypothetical protein
VNHRPAAQAVESIFTNLVTAVTGFVRQEMEVFLEACVFGHFCSFSSWDRSGTHLAKA